MTAPTRSHSLGPESSPPPPTPSGPPAPRRPRPSFTTSLSDFALPHARVITPSPLAKLPSAAPQRPYAASLSPATALTAYNLRPRSSLARSVISARDHRDDDDDEDDEEDESQRAGPSNGGSQANGNSGAYSRSSARRWTFTDASSGSGPTGNLSSSPHRSRRTASTEGDEDDDEGGEARSDLSNRQPSRSPRGFSAGASSRSSATPLSPVSSRPRRPRLASRTEGMQDTSPVHRNAAGSDRADHIEDVDIEVELDLDGLDMRMADAGEEESADVPSRALDPSSDGTRDSAIMDDDDDDDDDQQQSPSRHGRAFISQASAEWRLPDARARSPNARSASVAPRGANGRRPSVAPPLLRVMHLLRDESRPVESEVASEAKLTRRLGYEAEVLGGLRDGEASPFISPDASVIDSVQEPLVHRNSATKPLRPGIPRPTSELPWPISGVTSAANPVSLTFADDDDLLDNVGFESDIASSPGSDDYDGFPGETGAYSVPAAQSAAAAEPSGPHTDIGADESALSAGAQGPGGNDSQMDADEEMTQSDQPAQAIGQPSASAIPFAQTPPPRMSHLFEGHDSESPPLHGRTGQGESGLSVSATAPIAVPADELADRSGGSGLTSTTPGSSSRKRTGSVWTDFRNSPSAVSGNASSLEKRHQYRLQHGPYHRSASKALAGREGVSRLSTSPATSRTPVNAGPAMTAHAVHGGSPFVLSSSPSGATTPVRGGMGLSKRKFGSEERFEPYALSVHKRRAVSPLTGMTLPLSGIAGLNSGAGGLAAPMGSAGGSISPGAYRGPVGHHASSPTGGIVPGGGGGPGAGGGYFGPMAAVGSGSSSAGKRSVASSLRVGNAGILPGRKASSSVSQSPLTRPSTPTAGAGAGASSAHSSAPADASAPDGTAGAASQLSSSPPRAISPYRLPGKAVPVARRHGVSTPGGGPPSGTTATNPSPVPAQGVGAGVGVVLGSSPRPSGSGPGYGSGALGLSIAANSRERGYDQRARGRGAEQDEDEELGLGLGLGLGVDSDADADADAQEDGPGGARLESPTPAAAALRKKSSGSGSGGGGAGDEGGQDGVESMVL